MNKILKVNGMHCKSCETLLKDSISGINGVSSVKADSKKGIVEVNISDESVLPQVKQAIKSEGYKVD